MKIIDGGQTKQFKPITIVIENKDEAVVILDCMNTKEEITSETYHKFKALLEKRGLDMDDSYED